MLRRRRENLKPLTPTVCRQCNVTFTPIDRAYRYRIAKFCSPSCWYKFQRRKRLRLCRQCNKEFALHNNWTQKYCSHRCLLLSRGSIRNCSQCQREYHRPPTQNHGFCSLECYRNSLPGNPPRICEQCKKPYVNRDRAATLKTKFCSLRCVNEYWKVNGHPLWRGQRKAERGPTWKDRREEIRHRDGMYCQACGIDCGGRRPDVDHIIPYRYIIRLNKWLIAQHDSNHPENLISLCKRCHMQKTSAERHIFKGDILRFWCEVQLIIGPEVTSRALDFYAIPWRPEHEGLMNADGKPPEGLIFRQQENAS